jgi:hypothetical protein
MNRNEFLRLGASALSSLAIRPFSAAAAPTDSKFYFAIVADSHIID